jgi:hypothetical protein
MPLALQSKRSLGGAEGFEPPLIRGVPFWESWRMAKIEFGEFQFGRGREALFGSAANCPQLKELRKNPESFILCSRRRWLTNQSAGDKTWAVRLRQRGQTFRHLSSEDGIADRLFRAPQKFSARNPKHVRIFLCSESLSLTLHNANELHNKGFVDFPQSY